MNPESKVIIFTDGSSRGNPGPGGYAAVIILPQNNDGGNPKHEIRNPKQAEVKEIGGRDKEIGGREEHTTNNRMELQAAIKALSYLSKVNSQMSIVIYSDSSYLIKGITKWFFGWQKNSWQTATKKEVENRDLWEKLLNSTIYRTIEWEQVGGHVGLAGNERCDEIATAFADGQKPILYHGPLSKYPIKNVLNLYDISYKKQQAKSESRARQKAKPYSYVSQVDGVVQTHKTWAECEARVKGKSGAKYQKVLSPEEEAEIIALIKER
ncbi:MAG: hypothetical protein HYV67_00910 [Candidatus Taylorbacteria bacterium]|nr:hypothetical protein [Candidatus Taylorbacteria bacterium]